MKWASIHVELVFRCWHKTDYIYEDGLIKSMFINLWINGSPLTPYFNYIYDYICCHFAAHKQQVKRSLSELIKYARSTHM